MPVRTSALFPRLFKLLCCLAVLCFASRASETEAATLPAIIYTYDARPLNHLDLSKATNAAKLWDTLHVLTALQGLANRNTPRLYLFYCNGFGQETDRFWFDWFRNEDGWLKNTTVRPLGGLADAVKTFRPFFKGLVVYDPQVPATSDVASTAAGCEDLLPVRFDTTPGSVYDQLVNQMKLPVRLWLVNKDGTSLFTGRGQLPDSAGPSTGSAKVDAYHWAFKHFTGLCDPGYAAYYVDAFWLLHPRRASPTMHTLSDHDYFISHRAFFFDLSPWDDESPGDDLQQPVGSDRKEFFEIMRVMAERAHGKLIKIGGFPPWPFKYTRQSSAPGKHDGVSTEWQFSHLISEFNGYAEADAADLGAIANASFYQHYPLASHYPQPNAKPNLADWQARGYVTKEGKVTNLFFVAHYVGDYDSPSWLYKAVPAFFKDPARGQVPLGWAFDPNLADRAPQALAYAYRHATTNDFFIAGDSGAGYLNPHALTDRPDSGLPSGLTAWTEHCQPYYARWDMSITGFVLDGFSGSSTAREFAAYHSFSPDGIGTQFEKAIALRGGITACGETDLPGKVEMASATISQFAHATPKNQPAFLWARSVLKSPSWYANLSQSLAKNSVDSNIVVVDPYTFFRLIKLYLSEPR